MWGFIMTSKYKQAAAALALCAISVSVPAQAACWSEAAVSAAKLRDLETMLMVSALRCRISGQNMIADYNHLVVSSRAALTAANDQLRAHFVAEAGARGGLDAYDRYVTSVANRYGGGAEGLSCGDMKSILSAANAEGGSAIGLARLAVDAGVEPVLKGGRCPMSVAAR
jgi:hypothetical protein